MLIFISSAISLILRCFFFFFNDTATTEIYTLSLHDALPISGRGPAAPAGRTGRTAAPPPRPDRAPRSEEHTSELQSQFHLVCRLLLEKKNVRHYGCLQGEINIYMTDA